MNINGNVAVNEVKSSTSTTCQASVTVSSQSCTTTTAVSDGETNLLSASSPDDSVASTTPKTSSIGISLDSVVNCCDCIGLNDAFFIA